MADPDVTVNELTMEEMRVSPPVWLDIPDSALTLILQGTAVVGVVLVMIVGMALVFRRLRQRNEAFGANSIKALGLVLFLPSLMLLALVADFETETLAALLGVVAGYVLSNTADRPDQASSPSRTTRPVGSTDLTGQPRGPGRS